LIEPGDHASFDWHGNRNDLSVEQIEQYEVDPIVRTI
jgi:hypothetical protein